MKQKFKVENFFGQKNSLNINTVIKYMKMLDSDIQQFKNFGFPFFKGEAEFKYLNYLENKHLNIDSMNVEDVYKSIASLFQNIPIWSNPGTMINVIPQSNLAAVAATSVTNMLNPNFAQDTYAGFLIASELEVSKYMSDLIGWDYTKSHGLFTFGGKGTNLYATKVALASVDKEHLKDGITKKYFMITSQNAHPCHKQVCEWLGLGSDCCIEISCEENGKIDFDRMKKEIFQNIEEGKIFLGYNLNGGTTNELYVDPIKEIYEFNKTLKEKYNLSYLPHIHIDGVIGWVFLFFKNYDFVKNELKIPLTLKKKIQNLYNKIEEIKYADSVGIDFHKMGYCPYVSSMILFKEKEKYFSLRPEKHTEFDELYYGNYNPYETSLELSRSGNGPISALISLKTLGVKGFQQLLVKLLKASESFRNKLSKNNKLLVLNSETEGIASLFIVLPPSYRPLSLSDIVNLKPDDIDKIRDYNVNFSKFILRNCKENKMSVYFTSSRSYKLPNTNIKLGVLKAYPTSVFLNSTLITSIVNEIFEALEIYDKNDDKCPIYEINDNMVYDKPMGS